MMKKHQRCKGAEHHTRQPLASRAGQARTCGNIVTNIVINIIT